MTKLDDKLYKTRFLPSEKSHIKIIDLEVCRRKCPDKVCTIFCPAGVYGWEEDQMAIGYEGCLECGTCRYGCPYDNIDWHNPQGGYGVMYKFG